MSKEDLRLKAATTISNLFRKAAVVIDSLAQENSEWKGIFPHPLQFEEVTQGDHSELRYPLGERLSVKELRLKHDAHRLTLEIVPLCQEYLIPNFEKLQERGAEPLTEALMKKHANLRWDNATSGEIKSFFCDLFSARTSDTDFWANRAALLVELVSSIALELATASEKNLDAQQIRNTVTLDFLIGLRQSRKLSPSLDGALKEYLDALPGYNEDDALNGSVSPKVYEQHGYLLMQVMLMLGESIKHDFIRDYRLRSAEIEYQADAPISTVTAKVEGSVLVVSVRYIDTKKRNVIISS